MENNVGDDAVTVRLPRNSGEDIELTLGQDHLHAPELLFLVGQHRMHVILSGFNETPFSTRVGYSKRYLSIVP